MCTYSKHVNDCRLKEIDTNSALDDLTRIPVPEQEVDICISGYIDMRALHFMNFNINRRRCPSS